METHFNPEALVLYTNWESAAYSTYPYKMIIAFYIL